MTRKETWTGKLYEKQKKLIRGGDTKEWDPTLLFHALLYSSLNLLVDEITRASVGCEKKTIHMPQVPSGIPDLSSIRGRKILVRITYHNPKNNYCFVCECDKILPNDDIQVKESIKNFGRAKAIHFCLCSKPEFEEIYKLRMLRNDLFAHRSAVNLSDKALSDLIAEVRSSYCALGMAQDVDELSAIESGMCIYYGKTVYGYLWES